jgi:hypothetical protein
MYAEQDLNKRLEYLLSLFCIMYKFTLTRILTAMEFKEPHFEKRK